MLWAHVAGLGNGENPRGCSFCGFFGDSTVRMGTLRTPIQRDERGESDSAKTGHIARCEHVERIYRRVDEGRSPSGGLRSSILCNKYQGNVNPWQDQVCQAIYEWAIGK